MKNGSAEDVLAPQPILPRFCPHFVDMSLVLLALAVTIGYAALGSWGWRRARREAQLDGDEGSEEALPPLSVVVAARNEEGQLPDLLDALAAQTHPHVEVVIVDDASTDRTGEIATRWAEGRDQARVLHVADPEEPRKKRALTRGVKAARHDLLAFTDADCRPPPTWLAHLARLHATHSEPVVLAGYSPLVSPAGAAVLLGPFARYETLVVALYTAAAAGLGRPYMAVGRNLSYPRSVFESVGGFSDAFNVLSGDDDLLVQAVHRSGAARVLAPTHPDTHVPSRGPSSWTDWAWQKRRHLSAGRSYPWSVGLHLTLLHGSLALLWVAPLAAGLTGIGLLATGLLARHAALAPAADALGETDLLAGLPLGELGYLVSLLVLAPLGLGAAPKTWDRPSSDQEPEQAAE